MWAVYLANRRIRHTTENNSFNFSHVADVAPSDSDPSTLPAPHDYTRGLLPSRQSCASLIGRRKV